GGVTVVQQSPAHAQHHRPVPADQPCEGRFVAARDEALQQFGVGRVPVGAGGAEGTKKGGEHFPGGGGHGTGSWLTRASSPGYCPPRSRTTRWPGLVLLSRGQRP